MSDIRPYISIICRQMSTSAVWSNSVHGKEGAMVAQAQLHRQCQLFRFHRHLRTVLKLLHTFLFKSINLSLPSPELTAHAPRSSPATRPWASLQWDGSDNRKVVWTALFPSSFLWLNVKKIPPGITVNKSKDVSPYNDKTKSISNQPDHTFGSTVAPKVPYSCPMWFFRR